MARLQDMEDLGFARHLPEAEATRKQLRSFRRKQKKGSNKWRVACERPWLESDINFVQN